MTDVLTTIAEHAREGGGDPRLAKSLADFDFNSQSRLGRTRLLVRAGPALGAAVASKRIRAITVTGSVPANARAPVRHSKRMHPSAKTSAFASTDRALRICSGAM